MEIRPLEVVATAAPVVELDRLGDEIAELAAHLDAATARLLALIREFDARGGWNSGFRSCADWLVWRVGLAPGPPREKVRVARAPGTPPRLARALHVYPDATAPCGSRGGSPRRSAPCSPRRWPPPARPSISAGATKSQSPIRRPWSSSRRTRWPCSRKRRCTRASIRARPGSVTRRSS